MQVVLDAVAGTAAGAARSDTTTLEPLLSSQERQVKPAPSHSDGDVPAAVEDGSTASPARPALGCITVDEQGYIAVRAHKTTAFAAALPALGLLVYVGTAAQLGMDHSTTKVAGEVFLLSVGVTGLVLVTTSMAGCDCGGTSGGSGSSGGDKSTMPESVRMALCALGITVSFLFYGYVLESITSRGGKHFPEVIGILLNSMVYVGVSRLALWLQGQPPARVHARQFMAIAASSKLATFLTWRALRYVNFPTQVLAKSCKALPIMAVNRCAGKRHSWMQYTQVSLITGGVVTFMLYREGMEDKEAQANTLQGAVLLLLALGFDGLTGHLEDAVIKEMEWKHGQVLHSHALQPTLLYPLRRLSLSRCFTHALFLSTVVQGTFDLMLFINVYSIPFCMVYLLANGELLVLLTLSPSLTLGGLWLYVVPCPDRQDMTMLVWLSLAGALGQMCIFYTIANFGALTCSLITTLRKMMQIGLSALAFGHTFTPLQMLGVASSFTGVCVTAAILNCKSHRAQNYRRLFC